ncbi:putative Copia protein (Gag-int-pol protein), partial [Daphnia magna]
RGGQLGGRYRGAGSHRGGYNYRGHRGGPGNYSGSQTRNRGNHNDGRGYNHGSRPTFGSYDCYECGEPGHLARNCRNRRHGEERKARQGKQDSNRSFNDGGYENDQRDPTFNCLSSVCFLAKKTNDWYADSGATHHMTDQRHFFTTFKPVKPGTWQVYGIGSIKMEVHRVGNIEIHSYVQGEKNVGVLNDALFVPGIGANLFSLGTAMDRQLKADFE